MQNYSSKSKIIVVTVIVIMLGIVAIWYFQPSGIAAIWNFQPSETDLPAQNNALDIFAQCLTEKGAVMYGAKWCAHCQNQKLAFGDAFKYITYVECPDDPKKCIDAGIEGYPTWIFKDGTKLVGEQDLEKLSEVAGCPLPEGVK